MAAGLEQVYRDYLHALDDRRFDDLDRFVRDELTYNDEPWSREQYRARLEQDARTIPDLRYDLDLVVVSGDRVAARLRFVCHPAGDLLGLRADGRRLEFAEHVFYRFEEGRIAAVRSLIDAAAVRDQLAAPPS